MSRLPGVEHSQEADLLTLRCQLLRHLVRNEASKGEAEERVRAAWLHPPQFLHIKGRHRFQPDQRGHVTVKCLCLNSIDRLFMIKTPGQASKAQDIAADAVD